MTKFAVHLYSRTEVETDVVIVVEAAQFVESETGFTFFVFDEELEDNKAIAFFPIDTVWYITNV